MWGATSLCARTLVFLQYINDLYNSIGNNSMTVYAGDTAIIIRNIVIQKRAQEIFVVPLACCNKLSFDSDKTSFCCSM